MLGYTFMHGQSLFLDCVCTSSVSTYHSYYCFSFRHKSFCRRKRRTSRIAPGEGLIPVPLVNDAYPIAILASFLYLIHHYFPVVGRVMKLIITSYIIHNKMIKMEMLMGYLIFERYRKELFVCLLQIKG
jgi:hypothetical protein